VPGAPRGRSAANTSDIAEPARLLGPADVRSLADELNLRPTKSRGQNFVVDANTIRRIVRLADVDADEDVLEVGPGLGSLTVALLPRVRRLVAIELEPALADALPGTIAARAPSYAERLTVLTADALAIERGQLPVEPTALVANLPYNVAVPMLLHLLEEIPTLAHGIVMVQAEVADRLVAAPGSRIYGVPSVKLSWYAESRRSGAVSRTVFWPMPRVDSSLVTFRRVAPPATTVGRDDVFAVIDAAFGQRRKTLRAALADWAGGRAAAEQIVRSAGVDPGLRGEALEIAAFARLAEARASHP
jgi:16S rRNA (adenine1518-N6/adenine1519-N6)-dimethyltransferase